MVVQTPSPPSPAPDLETEAGVIEDARARQRRHRIIAFALVAAAAIGGLIVGMGGGGGGHGAAGNPHREPSGGGAGAVHQGAQSFPGAPVTHHVNRADFLTGVACTSVRACVAVGWFYSGAASPYLSLAARWNGRAWLAEPIPSRGDESTLFGISCASAGSCIAVGA